jgi:hypothetical protein
MGAGWRRGGNSEARQHQEVLPRRLSSGDSGAGGEAISERHPGAFASGRGRGECERVFSNGISLFGRLFSPFPPAALEERLRYRRYTIFALGFDRAFLRRTGEGNRKRRPGFSFLDAASYVFSVV